MILFRFQKLIRHIVIDIFIISIMSACSGNVLSSTPRDLSADETRQTETSQPTTTLAPSINEPPNSAFIECITQEPVAKGTITPTPPIGPLKASTEENGWITYFNDIVGYEFRAPKEFTVSGTMPIPALDLLGPAVPFEPIEQLIQTYYGDRLILRIFQRDETTTYQNFPWHIAIYASSILVNYLDQAVSPGGMGAYDVSVRYDELVIEGKPYRVPVEIFSENQNELGELGNLELDELGLTVYYSYASYPADPQKYLDYQGDQRQTILEIIQSIKQR